MTASIDALREAFDVAVVAASAAARAAELLADTALAEPIGEAANTAVEAEARLGWQLWLHTADDEYRDFAEYGEIFTTTKETA